MKEINSKKDFFKKKMIDRFGSHSVPLAKYIQTKDGLIVRWIAQTFGESKLELAYNREKSVYAGPIYLTEESFSVVTGYN